jgi:predicted nucleic acid-binding protein
MTRILIDTNVVLDLALDREPFAQDAQSLFEVLDQPDLEGIITATTITDLYYLLRKAKGRETAVTLLQDLLLVVTVAEVNHSSIEKALNLNWKDFEDALQAVTAQAAGADFLITRNVKDFQPGVISILSPIDFLAQF